MRTRAIMLALAVAAALGAGAGGASAATLFTTSAHSATVATGSAFSATATSPWTLTSATSLLNFCSSSSLAGTVTTNSGGTVAGNISSGSLSGCAPLIWAPTFSTAWTLVVSGSSTTAAGFTTWNATLLNLRFDLNNGPYSGSLLNGVTARQAHTSGPICLRFADSGTITGPLTGNGRIDTNYCFSGASANWSLG